LSVVGWRCNFVDAEMKSLGSRGPIDVRQIYIKFIALART
jgi:hypothetical protein